MSTTQSVYKDAFKFKSVSSAGKKEKILNLPQGKFSNQAKSFFS